MLCKLAEDPLDVLLGGLRLVDLVERNNDGDPRRLCVTDGLFGLRHDTVVSRYHQHDDVGHLRTTSTHFRKCLVPGSINECDQSLVVTKMHRHAKSARGLRNTTGLSVRNIAAANAVKQRSLAMVHMTENGHDR